MKKNRLLSLLKLALPVFLAASFAVQAQFTYTTNSDGETITITGYGGSAGALTIPASFDGMAVTGIGTHAFDDNFSLTSLTIEEGVNSIADYVFFDCANLASVTLPNSLAIIGPAAFFDCKSLGSVMVPNGVTNIANSAFGFCLNLATVTIGTGVTAIGEAAFEGCSSLTTITVDSNNPAYSSSGGVLFNKNQTSLLGYPAGNAATSYTVPNGVATIGAFAFAILGSLTNVTIPASVANLGSNAFYLSPGLTAAFFEGDAPNGGTYVFGGDTNSTAYYLAGTSGWGSTFCDIPTALWTLPYPMILEGSTKPRINAGGFSFSVSWVTNRWVVIEFCTNLANPVWQPIQTNALAGGSFQFSDPAWTNCPGRYYRIISP
ncbi:MAG TPA: leucine-rich repeat domain-containing protein [Candidatus Baltobacteraceae bacterium]|jgi:hypothetical protein|nr:leucine-rich repeat domain-containing protein [Candidatus Baltobacteraceae bacterium]